MPLIIISIAILLLVLLQNYCYKRLWDKGLSYDIGFSASEVFEGDELYLRERLTNKKFLPLPLVFVKIPVSAYFIFGDEEDAVPGVYNSMFSAMMYTAITRKKPLICHKRGVYSILRGTITVSNIMHTKQFDKDLRFNRELLVFPKPLYNFADVSMIFKQLDSAILTNRLINLDPFEFRGIRDYQPTDALKSVNFKASAIAQKLMVNIHAPTADLRLNLVLNMTDCGRTVPQDLYEQGIRLCAALAEHYMEKKASVSFSTNGRDSVTGSTMSLAGGTGGPHLYKIFECLARISTGYICESLTGFVDQLTDREQVYVFVSSYHGADFMDAFSELERRGVSAFLLVPVMGDMDVTVANSNNIAVVDVERRKTNEHYKPQD